MSFAARRVTGCKHLLTTMFQLRKEFRTAQDLKGTPGGRPIAMELDDLVMMFLTKARLGTPYYPLALQYRVSNSAAQRNVTLDNVTLYHSDYHSLYTHT